MKPDEPYGYTVDGIVGKAGGKAAVANRLGLKVQTVSKWGRRIPAQHAHQVAVMAGLPIEIVRPDMCRSGHVEALKYAQTL